MDLGHGTKLNLQEHLNKCRLCWGKKRKGHKCFAITETTEERFFELTQVVLVKSSELSKFICLPCEKNLENFTNFRINILDKQNKLNEARIKLEIHGQLTDLNIKTERVEDDNCITYDDIHAEETFIDCSTFSCVKVETELFEEPSEVVTPKLLNPKHVKPHRAKSKAEKFKDEEHKKLLAEFKEICKKKKEQNIQCPRCFKSFDRASIREHINVVHFQQRGFKCDKCDYQASRHAHIMVHMKRLHNQEIDPKYDVEKPKKQCNHCGAMIRNWRRHILKVHTNIRNFFCDHCPYASFFRYDLDFHMKGHIRQHNKELEKFYCDQCGAVFDKKFLVNAHLKAKHRVRERTFVCDVCPKTFFSNQNLMKHKESHNSKDMPCEICGKLFSCLNNLRSHLYIHSGSRFICQYPKCGKKFSMRKQFTIHQKTHENQKDFPCQLCKKGFYTNADLNRHIVGIHQKLRFFCEAEGCQSSFSRREYYRKHALAQHQNIGVDKFALLLQVIKEVQPSQSQS